MAGNLAVGALVDADQVAPLSLGVHAIVHYLTAPKLGILIEDFVRCVSIGDVGVVYPRFAHNSK